MGDKGELPVVRARPTDALGTSSTAQNSNLIFPPEDSIDREQLATVLGYADSTFEDYGRFLQRVAEELAKPEWRQQLSAAHILDENVHNIVDFLHNYPSDDRAARAIFAVALYLKNNMESTDPDLAAVVDRITGEHAAVVVEQRWPQWYFFRGGNVRDSAGQLDPTDEMPAVPAPEQRAPGAPLFTLPTRDPKQG